MPETSNSSTGFKYVLLRWIGFILWPLGFMYRCITGFRNHLYDIQYKKSIAFTPFIIDVGNLSVGGTGKSPMIEYLVRWLHHEYALAILSRGYRRQTRGFRLASPEDTAATLGDEPFQFYRKFSHLSQVVVAVGEERVASVPEILFHHPDTQVILLDDAFQHRAIAADFHILLTSYQQPFYQDHILPVGRLREARKEASRANMVVVTKCPATISEKEQQQIRHKIQRYTGDHISVFFSGLRYDSPVEVSSTGKAFTDKVAIFSGLADGSIFEAYARSRYEVVGHISFGDHHRYGKDDIQKIKQVYENAGSGTSILTTEKDMVKLIDPKIADQWKGIPLFYLPIQTYFLHDEDIFKGVILRQIQQYQQC